jgi:hypothetical protein
MEQNRAVYRVLVLETLRERDHLGGPGVQLILRWIFRKWDERVWIRSSWRRG